MASETGADPDRFPLALMTIITAFGIWWVQDIPDQCRPVAAVWVVTGTAVDRILREIGMYPLDFVTRMTIQA